ncbi:hypothetical protein ACHAPU_007493 [Fusarium lateritium]
MTRKSAYRSRLHIAKRQSEPDYQQSAWKDFSGIHNQDSEIDHSRGPSFSSLGRVSYLWPVDTFDNLEQEIMDYFPFTDDQPVPVALSTSSRSVDLNKPLPPAPSTSSKPVDLNKPLPPLPAEAFDTVKNPVLTAQYSRAPTESQSHPPDSSGQPKWTGEYSGSGCAPSSSLEPMWTDDYPGPGWTSSRDAYTGDDITNKDTSNPNFPFFNDVIEQEYVEEEEHDTFPSSSLFTKTQLVHESEMPDGEAFSSNSYSIYSPLHLLRHGCGPKMPFRSTYNTKRIPVKSVVSGKVSITGQAPRIGQVAQTSLPSTGVFLDKPSSRKKCGKIGKMLGKIRGLGFLGTKHS